MKCKSLLLALLFLSVVTSFVQASNIKAITLKDGSTVRGEILDFSQDQYTVKTNHLGEIKLNDKDILSISAIGLDTQQSPPLKTRVQNIQGIIYNDPQLMDEILSLINDPQALNLLANPTLINDIQSMDEERIRGNPALQQLLQNENVQRIMTKIQQKLDQE